MLNKDNTVHVMWTGGMDSTLVMILLSRISDINVLPVYICRANGRKTEGIELRQMNRIYTELKADARTKAKLLPIRIVADKQDLIPNEAEQFEYEYRKRIRYKSSGEILRRAQDKIFDLQKYVAPGVGALKTNLTRLADQYAAVISYVRSENVMVDLGIMGSESIFCLNDLFKMKQIEICGRTTYIFDETATDPDIYAVFHNVTFPIFNYNKTGCYNLYEELGYKHIRNMVWHCYSPINGKPCGKCFTCIHYIRDGIFDVFDRDALLRYIEFSNHERDIINKQYANIIDKILRDGNK